MTLTHHLGGTCTTSVTLGEGVFSGFQRGIQELAALGFGVAQGATPKKPIDVHSSLMTEFGKLLIVLGAGLVVAGLLLVTLGRMNLPLGRLPGDIVYRGKNTTFYFPLATSVVVSVVLSILLYLVGRWRR
jgi:hypothetical protein